MRWTWLRSLYEALVGRRGAKPDWHLLDQYAPDLAARLGALSLEQRRRVLAQSCAAMRERIHDLEPALRLLLDAAVEHNTLSREELASVRPFAEMADDKYFELQENPATAARLLAEGSD